MFRSIGIGGILMALFSMVVVFDSFTARAQQPDNSQSKSLNIQTSAGDLHVGNDADARKAGLPLYPGARLRHDEDESKAANLSLFTEAFGIKLVIVKYDSNDAPGKVISFYREKLKKYGKVIECHTREHGGTHADFNDDDSKEDHSKEVKCEADNAGPVTELKVGTEGNQHVVAIEPTAAGAGSTFALVYVHTRGKQGDI